MEYIGSFAIFVEHLEVHFEPSEIFSNESHKNVKHAFDLVRNDTNKILKKVSFNKINIKKMVLNK